ncbi:hypothetical protein DBR42_03790 [Pelomonas sp. HMWF004]|nr:hypothetical protein DBR42_03790 [Pelomonas sp. HMWF004]
MDFLQILKKILGTDMFQVRAYEARTVTWWYQRRDAIEFAPPFQRSGKLWSKADKAYLIDSILNEYDFPKLYLADFSYAGNSLNVSGKQFSVIDGRQRLETIFGFIEDQFPLAEDFVLEADLELDVKGLLYSELRLAHPKIALLFEQFNLPVMSVITDEAAKINQLFVRMNRNKPLTGAELRNAMKGAIPPAIRRIALHKFFQKKCTFPTNRGQDKNVAAKLLLLSHANQFVNTKKTDLDLFVKKFEQSSSQAVGLDAAITRTSNALDVLATQFSDDDPKLKTSSLIPVYLRIVEEHGGTKFGDFLTFWNAYTSVDEAVINEIDFVDDIFKSRIRLFQLLKRNVNESAVMQRLFVLMSIEFRRFQLGSHTNLVASMGRLKVRAAAVRAERKSPTKKISR